MHSSGAAYMSQELNDNMMWTTLTVIWSGGIAPFTYVIDPPNYNTITGTVTTPVNPEEDWQTYEWTFNKDIKASKTVLDKDEFQTAVCTITDARGRKLIINGFSPVVI